MTAEALAAHLRGHAEAAVGEFYSVLPRAPRGSWPTLLHGMGYNFEFYDALFALISSSVQLSLLDPEADYTPRHEAMQNVLQPFASEFGIEAGRPLQRSHRQLYAEFFVRATGEKIPERYTGESPWLTISRRWAAKMQDRIAPKGEPLGSIAGARYALGYHWAVERLSIAEFGAMRDAWRKLGVEAAYLDAHHAVEPEHDECASRAVLVFASASDPRVVEGIRDHEDDLAGYYRELTTLLRADDGRGHPS